MPTLRWLAPRLVVGLTSLGLVVGCGSATASSTPAAQSARSQKFSPQSLDEKSFPTEVEKLLSGGRTASERAQTLVSVIHYQLNRARKLIEQNRRSEAKRVVEGVFLLPRVSENFEGALERQGDVLLAIASENARQGDLPRAAIFYELAKANTTDDASRKEIANHLAAIDAFRAATRKESALVARGETADEALARTTVAPSAAHDEAAIQSVLAWLEDAAALEGDLQSGTIEDRDTAMEAYRAVRGGPLSLVALGLLRGQSRLALDALDARSLGRAIPSGMRLRLEAAEAGTSREALLDLYRFFESAGRGQDSELGLSRELTMGASLGTARTLYEKGTGRLDEVLPLAMIMLELGMPEVTGTIVSKAVRLDTPPEALAYTSGLVLRGMLELAETDQIEAANSLYEQCARLREVLLEPRNAPLFPIHERLTVVLANLEIQRGNLSQAESLFASLGERAPSPQTHLRYADLLAHRGKHIEAKAALLRALGLAEKAGDLGTEASTYERLYLLDRAASDWASAEKNLHDALARVLTARAVDLRAQARPALERLLARILEHYGDGEGERRAFARALEASHGKPDELTITVTDIARSALTHQNAKLSRLALAQIDEDGIDDDQKVYVALWHKLTLSLRGERADGRVLGTLTSTAAQNSWAQEIRKYALDKLSLDELRSRATKLAERTEVDFYEAYQSGKLARERLEKVAASDSIDLVEVRIAKDTLAPQKEFKLPSDLTIP